MCRRHRRRYGHIDRSAGLKRGGAARQKTDALGFGERRRRSPCILYPLKALPLLNLWTLHNQIQNLRKNTKKFDGLRPGMIQSLMSF
jgi:hypothetical protein